MAMIRRYCTFPPKDLEKDREIFVFNDLLFVVFRHDESFRKIFDLFLEKKCDQVMEEMKG